MDAPDPRASQTRWCIGIGMTAGDDVSISTYTIHPSGVRIIINIAQIAYRTTAHCVHTQAHTHHTDVHIHTERECFSRHLERKH